MQSCCFDDAFSLASFVTLAKHEGRVFAPRGANWDIKWPGMVIYLHGTFCEYNWIHIQLIRCPAPTYRRRCTAMFDGTLGADTQTQWRPGPALDYRHWRKVCSGPWKPPRWAHGWGGTICCDPQLWLRRVSKPREVSNTWRLFNVRPRRLPAASTGLTGKRR